MKLALYWNCRLRSEEGGVEASTSVDNTNLSEMSLRDISGIIFSRRYKPFYPRMARGMSANFQFNQYDIFVQALRTHAGLDFSYIRANIDLGPYDSFHNREEVLSNIVKCASGRDQVDVNWSRPSTIDEWIEDSKLFSLSAGNNTPSVFHFNHDHFFVGTRTALCNDLNAVEDSLSIDPLINSKGYYIFLSTHYSETLALFRRHHLSGQVVLNLSNDAQCIIEDTGSMSSEFSICGEFISQAKFMHYFWSKTIAYSKQIPSYIARPDWPGLAAPRLNLPFFLPTSEVFAHFDGLGRESLLYDLVKPLEVTSGSQVPHDNSVDELAQNSSPFAFDTLLDYFLRTRSILFEEIVSMYISGQLNLTENESLYSLFRYRVLPAEAISFLRLDLTAFNQVKLIQHHTPEITEGIITVKLIERSLLLLPRFYLSAVICKKV